MPRRRFSRLVALALLSAPLALIAFPAPAPAEEQTSAAGDVDEPRSLTGLPLPRFVSLRASEVNLRTGPGTRYPIDWVYRRERLPVEIIDEFETWRRIRDREGTTGWVHQSMLSSKRTAQVVGERRAFRADPNVASGVVAWLEPGVLLALERCEGGWCQGKVSDGEGGSYRGWLKRSEIWGAYADERLP